MRCVCDYGATWTGGGGASVREMLRSAPPRPAAPGNICRMNGTIFGAGGCVFCIAVGAVAGVGLRLGPGLGLQAGLGLALEVGLRLQLRVGLGWWAGLVGCGGLLAGVEAGGRAGTGAGGGVAAAAGAGAEAGGGGCGCGWGWAGRLLEWWAGGVGC